MPTDNNKIWSLAEAHLAGSLPAEEAALLQERLNADPIFKAEFEESLDMLRALNGSGRHQRLRSMLRDIQKDTVKVAVPVTKNAPRTITLKTHYLRTAGIAAGIAILTSLSTFWAVRSVNGRMDSKYSLLKRDLETYKKSQNQIISNIKSQHTALPAPAQYGGTGFALTNDGYLVTNYHVTEGADSIYIQNRDGLYYRAAVIGFDQKSDIAILKVEDNNFRFAKGEIPYTFASGKRKLGARVYTLGFPQEEIVYNEGYISSKNGFKGDSLQYRLEMPANPGQSGAPVLDASGNIIGIITGKGSETQGTTYAVSSEAILDLIPGLEGHRINMPKANKMSKLDKEQKIEKLELYTCAVKVYKN